MHHSHVIFQSVIHSVFAEKDCYLYSFLDLYPHPALLLSRPMALVEPAITRVPDVYGLAVTFTCTGTVPFQLVVNKEIDWLVDGVVVTDGVGPTSSPMGVTSTSELQTSTPSITGTYYYTCRVTLAVEGDPVLQNESTALLNVTGKQFMSSNMDNVHT